MSFQQLALQFRAYDSYRSSDYYVTPTMQMVWDLVCEKHPLLYIQGAPASGKTHLAHAFTEMHKGQFFEGDTIFALESLALNKPLAIDNCEKISDAEFLFHILNMAKEHKIPLLLTSQFSLKEFPHQLPDLISRLKAGQYVEIPLPDDMMIRGVLLKRFTDHQVRFQTDVLEYVIRRIPRSYEFLDKFFISLMQSLSMHPRQLTLPLVREVLMQMGI